MRESKGFSKPGGEMKVSFLEQADPRPVFAAARAVARARHGLFGALPRGVGPVRGRRRRPAFGEARGGPPPPSGGWGCPSAPRRRRPVHLHTHAGRRPRTCHYGGLGNGAAPGNRRGPYPSCTSAST